VDTRVVRLGAWCDLETEDDARRRLAEASVGAPVVDSDAEPRPGLFVPGPDTPVLDPRGLSFAVEEFAVLADGRRVRLHAERGFALSAGPDPWQLLTLESLRSSVLATVLPDDAEETGDEHPWDWLSDLLRPHGVDASPDELRRLPYDVELSDRLRARLPDGDGPAGH
jgi:hypothetical protein